MRQVARGMAVSAALLCVSRVDAAPTARIVYSRAVGADSCPDEQALRRAVASRVGYDPFFAWAKKTIVAGMALDKPRGFVARVALVDENGTEHGTRELRTEGPCSDLLEASALAIAIAIDPQSLAPRPEAHEPPPEPTTAQPSAFAPAPIENRAPVRVPAMQPSPAAPAWHIEASAGGVV